MSMELSGWLVAAVMAAAAVALAVVARRGERRRNTPHPTMSDAATTTRVMRDADLIARTEHATALETTNELAQLADLNPVGSLVVVPDDIAGAEAPLGTWRVQHVSDAAATTLQIPRPSLLPIAAAAQLADVIGVDNARRIESALGVGALSRSPALIDGVSLPQQPDRHFNLRVRRLGVRSIGVVLEDVTEILLSNQRLRRLALHDPLTSLPNRTLLRHHLDALLGEADTTWLAVLDIDDFAEVNDVLGTEAGDDLLVAVSRALHHAVPDADVVARIGDDEFAVAVRPRPGDTPERLSADIVGAFEAPLELGTFPLRVRPTIGVATASRRSQDAPGLLAAAGVAMRAAGRAGQRHRVWDPALAVSSPRRLAMLAELESAIDRHELELWFQPAVDLRERRVTKVEALARWRHPDHGLVEPAEFIRLAEASGLIEPLTRWMLDRVGELAAAEARSSSPLAIAANLSMLDVHNESTIDHLVSISARPDVDPSLIELEITETEIMGDPEVARRALTRLSTAGFALTVDDFGTGYSSLTYLQALPVSGVKLDRNFVGSMSLAPASSEIVRSTITLAHRLGLEVTAEGVASADTLVRLRDWGCDLAQGFWLSPPLPSTQLAARVTRLDERAREELAGPVDLRDRPSASVDQPSAGDDAADTVSNAHR